MHLEPFGLSVHAFGWTGQENIIPTCRSAGNYYVTEWPPIGKIAAHSSYEMFSWYRCLIVGLVFSRLGFWGGSLFLVAPFPDLCLLVLFSSPEPKAHR